MSDQVVILCGGRGTRMYPQTMSIPKALIDVCGQPVVRHVMGIYARQGFTEFVLAAGYKRELLTEFAATLDEPWNVQVVDTGIEANTGARVRAVADHVGERFFVTYADGLSDVDVTSTVKFHEAHGGVATMTTVPLRSQYGVVDINTDGQVTHFEERPVLADRHINGGFLIFDRRCFELWPDPGDDLERDVLPSLAVRGELFAYRHEGYWRSLDTYKDVAQINAECSADDPPWTLR